MYAASHDLSISDEPDRVIVEASEVYIHPDWNRVTMAGDIALIKLSQKLEFNGLNCFIKIFLDQKISYLNENLHYIARIRKSLLTLTIMGELLGQDLEHEFNLANFIRILVQLYAVNAPNSFRIVENIVCIITAHNCLTSQGS